MQMSVQKINSSDEKIESLQFKNGKVTDQNFKGKIFYKSLARNCIFDNCDFSEAVLQECDVTGSSFIYCNFHNAKIVKSDFNHTVIKNTNFDEAYVFDNNAEEMRVFLDGSTIQEWQQYQSKIIFMFKGMKNHMVYQFKSKAEKKKEQEIVKQQIKIIDYAVSLGFHVKRIGNYYTLMEHDSVRINPEKNCFWRNSNGASGSIIDFALEFTNDPIEKIIGDFVKMIDTEQKIPIIEKSEKSDKTGIVLPPKAGNMRNVYAYLISARGIHQEIVSKFVHERMLYQDKLNNCVFVCWHQNKPVYAFKRGTNTYKPFKGDIKGCDYQYGFFINNQAQTLIITEGIIDAMSVMTILKEANKEIDDYNYLPICGLDKKESIFFQLRRNPNIKRVVVMLDNDNYGLEASSNILHDLKEMALDCLEWLPEHTKDWNDELRWLKENGTQCEVKI